MSIGKEEIRRLHAVAAHSGLIVGGDRSDLKSLVHSISGKDHVSDLNAEEYRKVYASILSMGKSDVPGMMRETQIKKAWALLYELCEIDQRDNVTPKARMVGVIKTVLGVDVPPEGDIFRWVPEKSGRKLIEKLKQYVASEQRKQERESG